MGMAEKHCRGCDRTLPQDSFNLKDSSRGTRQSRCRDCQKSAKREHYANNRAEYVTRASRRKKEIREEWQHIKSGYSCSCGESHPACIEFHHPEDNKEADVSRLFNDGSLRRGAQELEKCVPLCANCHRKLHHALRKLELKIKELENLLA